ncbi:MAG TPA: ankyrin repeat domain-containing protein [Azospira sp.]|nr:ankyrin repeat domain-containing protein [Azospira sp.]
MRKLLTALLLTLALPLSLPAQAGIYDDMLRAVLDNHTEEAIALLDRGMDPNTADAEGSTLLMLAARNGNEALVDQLILRRAKVAARNRYGDDALLLASFRGYLPVVKLLVAGGAPLNRSEGWPPLAYAAFNGQVEVMDYLLAKGADVNGASDNGTTALMVAARNGHIEAVRLLLKHKPDVDKISEAGGTALKWAVAANNTAIADLLRKAGAVLE